MHKLRVGILFGGRSAEHEVSLLSAKNVIQALDRDKYDPVLIGIDKQGGWHLQKDAEYLLNADDPKRIALSPAMSALTITPSKTSGAICPENLPLGSMSSFKAIDVIFPVLHGTNGEDGTVQGLLKLLDIPFVGASILGSSVGMDKDVMKRLLRDSGIPIGKFRTLYRESDIQPSYKELTKELGDILFIKPANAGSSVGVSKVRNENEFTNAITEAFRFDRKILVEEFIKGREIECAVLGNFNPIVSVPGEIIPSHDFYSYDAKYIDANGARPEIPAKLSAETSERVREIALKTFKALECEGMGRVDVFVTENEEIFVIEINTIPGFTKISMYPKLFEASGIGYSELLDRLIQLAIERHTEEKKSQTSAN
jgi:D-alanine-D-alanine ligase